MVDVTSSTLGRSETKAGSVATRGDHSLASLSDSELGCVVEELLIVLEPAEVVALTASGPATVQAPVVLDALRSCDLVLELAQLGLTHGLVGDSGTPELDPTCVLEGVTEDDIAPVLEALFAGVGAVETGEVVDILLLETPVMSNLVRCGLQHLLREADGEVPPFCQGLLEQVEIMMTVVVEHDTTDELDVVDPALLTELFDLFDDVFVWLADKVPYDYRTDAEVVRDASRKVSELIAEALYGLDDDSDPQVVLGAVFGVVARIDAELAVDSFRLESARTRLKSYVTTACGESTSSLFDVLSGAGALSGV